jgi:transposase-like protein
MRQLRSELRAKWHELVSEQGQSGQTVKAFCLERGIRDSLFYDWKKRLRESEMEKFVEVKVIRAEERAQRSAFSGKPIEVRLNNGRSLMVEPGFDASHLRALLAVLETGA